jgi:hypothetical protein
MPAIPKVEDTTETATPVLPKAEKDPTLVEVTITKFGEGLVSTGVHVTGEGDIYAKRGEKLQVSKATAARLETLGLAEAD